MDPPRYQGLQLGWHSHIKIIHNDCWQQDKGSQAEVTDIFESGNRIVLHLTEIILRYVKLKFYTIQIY